MAFEFTQQQMKDTQTALDVCVQATMANMKTLEADCAHGINSGLAGLSVAALENLLEGTIKPIGVDIGDCFDVMRQSLAQAQGKYNVAYDQAAGDALKKLHGDVRTPGPLSQKLSA